MTSIALPPNPAGLVRRRTLPASKHEALAIVRLAAPLTGLALVNMAMSVTDTVMTAAFGARALAAVAVGSDFYSICFYLAIGCISGLAPLYAAAHAAGDTARLARLRTAAILAALGLALPLGTVLWFAPAILRALGIDPALVEVGTGYVRAMALTMLPMLAVGVLRTRLTAIERPGIMLRITLCAVPLNAILNHAFMHGAFGWPGLGATGAGVASFVVTVLTLAALAVETRRVGDGGLGRVDLTALREIFRIGVPIGIATLAEVGIYLGATLYAATLTVTDAAAHSIVIRLAGVTFAFYFGLQQAAMIRLARACAAPERRAEIVATAMMLGLAVGVVLCGTLLTAAPGLVGLMLPASTPGVAGIAVGLVCLLAIADLCGPAGAVAGGLLRGVQITRPVMVYSIVGNWCVAAPLALILTLAVPMGATGIWIALVSGTIVSSVLSVRALRRHAQAAVP